MDEYISREAAMRAVTALNLERNLDSVYDEVSYRYHRAAERAISTVPAADVRPVILCRNCFFYRKDPELARANFMNPEEYCSLLQTEFAEEGFCSYGKEKGND